MRFKVPALRRGTSEGTKQAANILRAARTVFASEGAAAFSARRVAREAKLGLASVQHVFPTVESLLVAMFESVVNDYDESYRRTLEKLPLNGKIRLSAILDFLIEDLRNPTTRRLFFGFWAFSCHNRLVAKLMQQAYVYHRDNVAGFIAAVRSDLADEECRLLAASIISMIDGAMIFTAPGARIVPQREFLARLKQSVLQLIDNAQRSETERPRTDASRRRSEPARRPASLSK